MKSCGVFFDVLPAIGAASFTFCGNRTAHSYVCCAPMEPPVTSCSSSMPNCSRKSCSCARTSSPILADGPKTGRRDGLPRPTRRLPAVRLVESAEVLLLQILVLLVQLIRPGLRLLARLLALPELRDDAVREVL